MFCVDKVNVKVFTKHQFTRYCKGVLNRCFIAVNYFLVQSLHVLVVLKWRLQYSIAVFGFHRSLHWSDGFLVIQLLIVGKTVGNEQCPGHHSHGEPAPMLNGLRHFNFKQIEIIPLWEYSKCYNWSNITKISSSLFIKRKPTDWSWNLGNHWTDCYTNYWHTASIKVECSLINNFFLIQSGPHETSFF